MTSSLKGNASEAGHPYEQIWEREVGGRERKSWHMDIH